MLKIKIILVIALKFLRNFQFFMLEKKIECSILFVFNILIFLAKWKIYSNGLVSCEFRAHPCWKAFHSSLVYVEYSSINICNKKTARHRDEPQTDLTLVLRNHLSLY